MKRFVRSSVPRDQLLCLPLPVRVRIRVKIRVRVKNTRTHHTQHALTLALTLILSPLMPLKGFSCSKQARPCLAATSSRICMNITFWSICTDRVKVDVEG